MAFSYQSKAEVRRCYTKSSVLPCTNYYMFYKFDILFMKAFAYGGVKLVSYSSLLKNPKPFGENETLEGVTGTLSVVKEGAEKGYSLNSLLRKYHSLLVGKLNAETWDKEFPIQFSFNDSEDVSSLMAHMVDETGYLYSSKIETKTVKGEETIDLSYIDSFICIIPKDGNVNLTDEIGTTSCILKGEVAFVTAFTHKLVVNGRNVTIITITCEK